ncbi:hypothetical protein OAQ44_02730 [Candidatus Pseudothioglobus singularis]|jgi:hypothetical protein|nr:hypothetical protein [Candidatus Pseudothioglobus singularis]
MKKLLLLLILSVLSAQSLSKVGDTYWCSMTQFINVTVNEIEKQPLELFNFEREKEQVIFYSAGYFGGWSAPVTIQYDTEAAAEIFKGGTEGGGIFKYMNGSFGFNFLSPTRAHTILADCSIN